MKRDFRDENFEEFLKRSADNLRMKAPERVWQNLSNQLNKSRRRIGAGLNLFLFAIAILSYLSIDNGSKPVRNPVRPGLTTETERTATNLDKKASTSAKRTTGQFATLAIGSNKQLAHQRRTATITKPVAILIKTRNDVAAANDLPSAPAFSGTITDDSPEVPNSAIASSRTATKPSFLLEHDATPYSIESVVNAYSRKRSRFQTEFHFTPTISYRKLSENKSFLRNTSAFNQPPTYAALFGSVNNMVTHKPDIGFELGMTEKYALSQKVRVRAGVQFNVNRYDIKAFQAPYAVATIALNTRRGSGVDSVRTLSNYSNVDGSSNKSNWLQNLSFQVSAPIGVELFLKGNDKMKFGIATTVQPTYVLGDRAYLITTDYKSYTQVPWLLRRWNVNTAFETFVSYQSGKTVWQVGPQVRYQLLSSFISNYPVKENLFDFGLKIGISMNK